MTRWISPSGLLLFYVCSVSVLIGHRDVSGAAPAGGLDGGRITVAVINQTTGKPLGGQEVLLLRHLGEQSVTQLQGVTDKTGRFAFVSLPIDSAHYVVTTRYHDVVYTTEPISLQDSSATRDSRLDVYDTTAQDTDLLVEAHHLIIDAKPTTLDITEILVFHNNRNTTFVGTSDNTSGARGGIRLSLPPNAFQFQPMSAGIEETAQGPVYTQPVPPGPTQVVYAYSVDRKSINNVLSQRLAYDTGRVQALIIPSDLTVTSTRLTNNGVRRIGEKDYLLLSNPAGLRKGTTLDIRFPNVVAWQDALKWGAVGLVALMVVVGVSAPYMLKRRKTPSARPTPQHHPTQAEQETLRRQHQHLIQAIADLDDRYEAGEIDQAVYKRQRSDLKGRAVDVLRRLTDDTDA